MYLNRPEPSPEPPIFAGSLKRNLRLACLETSLIKILKKEVSGLIKRSARGVCADIQLLTQAPPPCPQSVVSDSLVSSGWFDMHDFDSIRESVLM